MPRLDRSLTGSALILLGASCYGFFAIFTKLAYRDGNLAPLDVAMWRFLIASATIWLLSPFWRRHVDWSTLDGRRIAIFLGLGVLLATLALVGIFSLLRVSATTYTLLLYTFPAMVALASFILGERLLPTEWAALGLALIGCALTVGAGIAIDDLVGVMLVLVNAMLYGTYMMAIGKFGRGTPGILSAAIIILGALISLAPLGIVRGLQMPSTLQGWGAIIGLGVVSTVLSIVLVFSGTIRIGAPRASILSTMEPVLTVIWAAILLGEHIRLIQFFGGVLIITSVILLQLPPLASPPDRD